MIAALLLLFTYPTVDVPPAVQTFIEEGTRPIILETADLNEDGIKDHLLILERLRGHDDDDLARGRILRILLGAKDGALRPAVRNEAAIGDSSCGGAFGDCLEAVTAKKGTIRITEYGGSGSRWSRDVTFRYSRRAKTWRLVEIESMSFHASDPDDKEVSRYRPRDSAITIETYDFAAVYEERDR